MLCNRLGIMKNGELKCIGYIQKLKEKYGKGFSLMIKVKPKAMRNEGNPMEISRTEIDSIDSNVGPSENITDIKLQILRLFSGEIRDEHDVSFVKFDFITILMILSTGRSSIFHQCQE